MKETARLGVVVGDDAGADIGAAVENVQIEPRRQRLAHPQAAHAVAVAVEARRKGAEPHLQRQRGNDAAAQKTPRENGSKSAHRDVTISISSRTRPAETEMHCHSYRSVGSNIVSAERLSKTGVSTVLPGDFRDILARVAVLPESRDRSLTRQKPYKYGVFVQYALAISS